MPYKKTEEKEDMLTLNQLLGGFMRFKYIFFAVVTVCLFAAIPANLWAERNKETMDFQSAEVMMINAGIEPKLVRLYAAIASDEKENLPEVYYDMTGGGFCGTSISNFLQRDWSRIPPAFRSALQGDSTRPVNQTFKDFLNPYNPSGLGIRVHYDTTGPTSVPLSMVDTLGKTAVFALFTKYNRYFGFRSPVSDNGRGGTRADSVDQYDIYLVDLPYFGEAIAEEGGTTSYVKIDFQASGVSLDMTAAHELFHAVQLNYVSTVIAGGWWGELTANWAAAQISYEIENKIEALFANSFFGRPSMSLMYFNADDDHHYGAFVWGMYLTQRYDYIIIRNQFEILSEILNQYATPNDAILAATDSCLKTRNITLLDAFKEFTIWNYFTGSRYSLGRVGLRYARGAEYPMVPETSIQIQNSQRVDTLPTIDYLAAKYVRYDTAVCRLVVRFNLTLYPYTPSPPPPCTSCTQGGTCVFDTIACCPPNVPVCDLSDRCPRFQRDKIDSGCIVVPPELYFSQSTRFRNSLLVFPKSGGFDTVFTQFIEDTGKASVNMQEELSKIVAVPINVQPSGARPVMASNYARLRGDMNNDCSMSASDFVRLQYWVCCCMYPPVVPGSDDVNCDGLVNNDDVYFLHDYIFMGAPVPCAISDFPPVQRCGNSHVVAEP